MGSILMYDAAKPSERPAAPRGREGVTATVHYLTPPSQKPSMAPSAAVSSAKRALDFMIAAFALLVFLPLFMVIAVAVRFESPGNALFRQRRTGLGGKVFTILKFRTMNVSEDDGDIRHATRHDARITTLGLILRKTSLDEIPQLFNVLRGDMSIVGPRPHALAHDDYYGERVATYNQRFRARPGLTGLAQVRGYRGEIHDLKGMADRISADNEYIDSWSLWRDIWLIICTLPLMLKDPNAY